MSVVVIAPPAGEVLSLESVKSHLRITWDDDDALLGSLTAAAVGWIDGPSGGWLGRALGAQDLLLAMPCFVGTIRLPFPPIIEIAAVEYTAPGGATEVLDSGAYEVTGDGKLKAASGYSWPATESVEDAVRVSYRAGYDNGVPEPILLAARMLVAHWFNNPEALAGATADAPFSVTSLLSPVRVW